MCILLLVLEDKIVSNKCTFRYTGGNVTFSLPGCFRSTDVFVMETHLVPWTNTCAINFPSSERSSLGSSGMTIDEALHTLMHLRISPEPVLCFSLSLATFQFTTGGPGVPGASCNGVETKAFRDVSRSNIFGDTLVACPNNSRQSSHLSSRTM